jgi:glutamate-1-semialdehyde 2,1-aminomutase
MMADAARQSGERDAAAAQQAILRAYRARTPASAAMFERARRSLLGGTTGNLRYFPPYPLYFASGAGSRMTDIDGHEYIDCFLCNGPLLLGHRHPAIVAAVERSSNVGSLVVNPELAVQAAEQVQSVVPSAERVRFLNSGTEAVMAAVRMARAHTGRAKIIKFLGHYHGQDDQFLVGLEPTASPFGAGVPDASWANTVLLPHGNAAALEQALASNGDIAAVLLDPAMHSGGLWGSETHYLQQVRHLTSKHGVVLIFDEVITGFRLAAGGAQALHGVTPDLTTLAKALGAGEKLAAVAGREACMRNLDPFRPTGTPAVFQSGTGNDGTAGLAAGAAAVTTYAALERAGEYVRLHGLARRLAAGLTAAFAAHGVPFHANQHGPMLQLFLSADRPSFEAYAGLPGGPIQSFYLALINEGILLSLPTSNHIYLSFAHTEADIDRVIEKASVVLNTYDFRAIVAAAA